MGFSKVGVPAPEVVDHSRVVIYHSCRTEWYSPPEKENVMKEEING